MKEKIIKLIVTIKKKMIGESAAHTYISCILTLLMLFAGLHWGIAILVVGFINFIPEVLLPQFTWSDVLYGLLGGVIATILFFITHLFI